MPLRRALEEDVEGTTPVAKGARTMMECLVVIFEHRHGVDAWPVFAREKPSVDDVIETLKAGGMIEEDRDRIGDNTFVEVRGPWKIQESGYLT